MSLEPSYSDMDYGTCDGIASKGERGSRGPPSAPMHLDLNARLAKIEAQLTAIQDTQQLILTELRVINANGLIIEAKKDSHYYM